MRTLIKNIIYSLSLLLAAVVVSCNETLPADLFLEPPVDIMHENGRGYVDLGLPSGLLWARCNVGAASPEGYGYYYSWGEIEAKEDSLCSVESERISDISGLDGYDAARSIWGSDWRVPTAEEFAELMECCTFNRSEMNGVSGCNVAGPNGNVIFLPFAGYIDGDESYKVGSNVYFWTATSTNVVWTSDYFAFATDGAAIAECSRNYGLSIRPVLGALYASENRPQDRPQGDQTVNNGHIYVDLGLSVKWATCNVGAAIPEEYGGYYAWGETEEKDNYNYNYNWSTYKWCNGSENTMTKYCTDSYYGTVDNKTVLDPEDDVAHVKWGGSWRMPTKAEQNELRNSCTWTWTTQNGVNGYKFTSKTNGNSIFLPAAGYRNGAYLYDSDSVGNYWSSSLDSYGSVDAVSLCFDGSIFYGCGIFSRYIGCSVRPVCE